jgi:hypothetical protein
VTAPKPGRTPESGEDRNHAGLQRPVGIPQPWHGDADARDFDRALKLRHASGRPDECVAVDEEVRVSRQGLRAKVVPAREADILLQRE